MEGLVYVSTATALPARRVIDDILTVARRNNPALDLTGMLLWKEMRFAQYLEGPPAALDRMWATLNADPRHEDVRLLSRRPVEARLFSDWSMGSRRLDRRHYWELLEKCDHERPEVFATWLLVLMSEARHRARLHR
jgi:hypothetical protein